MEALRTSIMVDCGGGWKLRLKAEGPTTVLFVKDAIQEETGIPIERQSLSYGCGDLPDDELIHGGVSAVFLTVEPLPAGTKFWISVDCLYPADSDYQEEFEVTETDTVMELKQKILASLGFRTMVREKVSHVVPEELLPEDVVLWRTEGWEMKDLDSPLSKYRIHDACSVDLVVHAINRQVSDPAAGSGKPEESSPCSQEN